MRDEIVKPCAKKVELTGIFRYLHSNPANREHRQSYAGVSDRQILNIIEKVHLTIS